MEWLSQNWMWLALMLIIGVLALVLCWRAGSAGGCCDEGKAADAAEGSGRRVPPMWILAGAVAVALYFILQGHRVHALEYLPYLILLACPLLHLFMHRGQGHTGHHPTARKDRPE